jgi:uncharacterized damage-inducible protein DinB
METGEDLDRLVARLAAIPERIIHAVKGWSDARLHASPAQDTWSAAEVFAHMRACDDINAYRVYAILARDNPPLVAYNERRWENVVGYARADFHASLKAFTLKRAELIDLLRRMAPADWQRGGDHEEFGPLTIARLLSHVAGHEEEHCAQIEALYSI